MSSSIGFLNAPHCAQVTVCVKQGIFQVTEIVDILNHPVPETGDAPTEYTLEQVTKFKARATQSEYLLQAASTCAQVWQSAATTQVPILVEAIAQIDGEIHAVNDAVSQNQEAIQETLNAMKKLASHLEYEKELLAEAQRSFDDARKHLEEAKAHNDRFRMVKKALSWLPAVSIALGVGDLALEENDVKCASEAVESEKQHVDKESQVGNQHVANLLGLKKTGLELHSKLIDLEAKRSKLATQKKNLEGQVTYLATLQGCIDQSATAVAGTFGSAAKADLVSMKSAGDEIKALILSLQDAEDFQGLLAELEDKHAELDGRIRTMQRLSQKVAQSTV